MAITTGRNKPKLTPEQVLEARRLFYREIMPYTKIMEIFEGVASKNTLIAAIQGKGPYKDIEDDIPQEYKGERKPLRENDLYTSKYAKVRKANRNNPYHTPKRRDYAKQSFTRYK